MVCKQIFFPFFSFEFQNNNFLIYIYVALGKPNVAVGLWLALIVLRFKQIVSELGRTYSNQLLETSS